MQFSSRLVSALRPSEPCGMRMTHLISAHTIGVAYQNVILKAYCTCTAVSELALARPPYARKALAGLPGYLWSPSPLTRLVILVLRKESLVRIESAACE